MFGNPTFNLGGGGVFGENAANSTGSGAYDLCTMFGGSAATCGGFGAQAGTAVHIAGGMPADSSGSVSVGDKSLSTWDRIKLGSMSALGIASGNYNVGLNTGLAATTGSTKFIDLSTSRITMIIIGIIFIGAALFLLKASDVVTVATHAIKGE